MSKRIDLTDADLDWLNKHVKAKQWEGHNPPWHMLFCQRSITDEAVCECDDVTIHVVRTDVGVEAHLYNLSDCLERRLVIYGQDLPLLWRNVAQFAAIRKANGMPALSQNVEVIDNEA